jgi:hypothetical protein
VKVRINRTDGEPPLELDAVKPPWHWRTFLVIDQGVPGQLKYVSSDLVESFDVEGVVL